MDSQHRSSQVNHKAEMEEEWQIVPTSWRRTPFSSISWSYNPEKTSQGPVFAKPPHYHRSLYNKNAWELSDDGESGDEVLRTPREWHSSARCRIVGEDGELNEDLVGVKGASDALRVYEAAVGFESSTWPELKLGRSKKRESLLVHVSPMEIELARERWNELVEDLVGGRTLEHLLRSEKIAKPATQNSSVSQAVLFNSDYFSRPLTPKTFRLNPSASSFVPLGSPTFTSSSSSGSSSSDPSDRCVAFAFSPLANFPPLANSGNDHQGGSPGIPSRSRTTSSASSPGIGSDRPSASALPPFLEPSNQRRRPNRTSRTRAIVDQLRSQHHQDAVWSLPPSQDSSPTLPEFGMGNLNLFAPGFTVSEDGAVARSNTCSSSPPLTEEEHEYFGRGSGELHGAVGGWTLPPAPTAVDPETKKNRSKELFMALRRRTDSLSSSAHTNASLPVLRPTLSGAAAASAPSAITDAGRLIGSPEPVFPREEDEYGSVGTIGMDHTVPLLPGANIRNSSPTNSSCSSPTTPSDVSLCRSPNHVHIYTHVKSRIHPPRDAQLQNHTYTHSRTKSTSSGGIKYNSPDCFTNPATGGPYTFLSLPLPVSGVPLNIPIPVSVPTIPLPLAIANPGAIPVPVQVPVQTMQYSTLMHLRIMQQVQMMRNSMGHIGLAAAPVVGNTARTRARTPSNTGMIR